MAVSTLVYLRGVLILVVMHGWYTCFTLVLLVRVAALTNAPVLVMPDYSKPFELIADACGFGIGAALLQEGQPVAYLCKQFSDAERNYTVGEQELLAVVHAMRTWRCYLEGVNADMLTVVTKHEYK